MKQCKSTLCGIFEHGVGLYEELRHLSQSKSGLQMPAMAVSCSIY